MPVSALSTFHAGARVDGVAAPAAYLIRRGLGTLTDTGAGDWLFDLEEAIDPLERAIHLTTETALGHLRVVQTSDTQFQVLGVTVAAGNAALDQIFNILVNRLAP